MLRRKSQSHLTPCNEQLAIPGGGPTSPNISDLGRRTVANCPVDIIAENTALANNTTKENAANLAGFNGAKDVVGGVCSYGEYITLFPILATHWGVLV